MVLFVAAVLLWSGLGSAEARALSAAPEQQLAVAGETPPTPHDGSQPMDGLDGFDDMASAVFGDPPPSETPGLLPAPLHAGFHAFVMARPRGFAPAGARSPFLAGPLRPPCSVARAG